MNILFTAKTCNILKSNVIFPLVLALYQVLSSSRATYIDCEDIRVNWISSNNQLGI